MKRLLFLLCLLPTWASAATYYVDCNANGDAGAGTGTGAAVAWKTINKVNNSSFSAGDSVLFNKGCTWRETLTVPSSGSAGSPITFGAYGTGAAPIINGADLVTEWAASAAWADAASHALTSSEDQDAAGRNCRGIIAANAASASGTKVRLSIKAPAGGASILKGVSIGEMTTTSTFDAAPTRVTFSAADSVTVSAGATTVSDEIDFVFDKTKRYGIHLYWVTDAMKLAYVDPWEGGSYINWSNAGDKTLTTAFGTVNATLTSFYGVTKLEVYGGATNTWQAAVTTEPKVVAFDGLAGTNVASLALVNGDKKWFWDANVLYAYSVGDPATTYVAPGIEDICQHYQG